VIDKGVANFQLKGEGLAHYLFLQEPTLVDRAKSKYYSLREHSVEITAELVLSLLWWKDERQLSDFEEEEAEREDD